MTPQPEAPLNSETVAPTSEVQAPELLPAPPPRPMEPVSASERIDVIDILRGLALFGILTANMRGFTAPDMVYGGYGINKLFHSNLDWIAQAIEATVFQGKFVTLFSVLFGLGFAVQMTRAQERGRPVSFYPRRLTILLVIGLIHALLIWFGDILMTYALIGFLLFFFRNSSKKKVAIWTISLASLQYVMFTGYYIASVRLGHPPGRGPENPAEFQRHLEHAISVFRDGGYIAATQLRWHSFRDEYFGPTLVFLTVFILPRFLAGLWVWRSGLLKNPEPYLPRIKQIAFWGLGIGLVCDAVALYVKFVINPADGVMTFPAYVMGMAETISWPCIAAFYACSVFLLVRSPIWRIRLTPFGAVGRMALSNYLLESIVCTWFFRLTHLYGSIGPAADYAYTVALFALQIPLSVWWLKHYHFGPVEWVWRSLTYRRMQPMRRTAASMPEPAMKAAAGA